MQSILLYLNNSAGSGKGCQVLGLAARQAARQTAWQAALQAARQQSTMARVQASSVARSGKAA